MKNVFNSTGHQLKYGDIVRAQNCTLYDSKGNSYLDLESGVWSTSLGHCHPEITELIQQQSQNIVHTGYCYLNPVVSETAQKLIEITGLSGGKCVFLNSGSEAVEYAVMLTEHIRPDTIFSTFDISYLSAFGSSGRKEKARWELLNHRSPKPGENVNTFIFEPGSASGAVNFLPDETVQSVVDEIKSRNGIIIANEITTGIGRTGKWFGYNHYNIKPDIVAIGKGLGSGYPVSAVVISERILNMTGCNDFHYSQSHQNDPLGAAVAGKVIGIIQRDELVFRAEQLGAEIRDRLEKIKNNYGIIKEIRGRGLLLAIEFENNKDLSYATAINEKLHHNGIILVKRPGLEVFRLDPALTITEADINYFLDTFENLVADVAQKE